MSQDDPKEPRSRPAGASKSPPASAKGRSAAAEREARLAEALRANLRRRKAGGRAGEQKEEDS